MGGSSWSDSHYTDRVSLRAESHTPTFKHDSDVRTGKVAKALHPSLDVKGVKMRESRDSDAHPNSRAVAVLIDVTGSMRQVPEVIQKKLPTLMGILIRKGHLTDPHLMVGAIGDATCDTTPIQIGQFEAGIEIDDNITNLYLEGGGGGSNHESYELSMYFMAERTSIDCFEKRGDKGFLFIIGDEKFYAKVSHTQVERHLGNGPQADIDTMEMIKSLQEKYEVFFIMPNMTSNYGSEEILKCWKATLGQNVLLLDEPSGICELIASTIAITEGSDLKEIAKDMKSEGTSSVTADSVSRSLATYASTTGDKPTSISVPTSGEESGLVEV